jgi:hypothetical protein
MNLTTTRRIVQIPIRGPVRYGTILSVSAHNLPAAAFIEWTTVGKSGSATRTSFHSAFGSSARRLGSRSRSVPIWRMP